MRPPYISCSRARHSPSPAFISLGTEQEGWGLSVCFSKISCIFSAFSIPDPLQSRNLCTFPTFSLLVGWNSGPTLISEVEVQRVFPNCPSDWGPSLSPFHMHLEPLGHISYVPACCLRTFLEVSAEFPGLLLSSFQNVGISPLILCP